MPKPARNRVLKNAAISSAINGGFGAGGPWLLALGRLPHTWEEAKALLMVFGYGAFLGLYLHFKQPGYRLPEKPSSLKFRRREDR